MSSLVSPDARLGDSPADSSPTPQLAFRIEPDSPVRSLVSKLNDLLISPMDEGAVGDGTRDDTTSIERALNALAARGGGTLALYGRRYGVSRSIHLPEGVSVEGSNGAFVALPGFRGEAVLLVVNDRTLNSNAAYARARRIEGITIDCSDQKNVSGIVLRNTERDRVINSSVFRCRKNGISLFGGYGTHLVNSTLVASSIRRGSKQQVDDDGVGILIESTDTIIDSADISFFPIGVHTRSGHNQIVAAHPWSTYWADDPVMLHGFMDEGEGNTFTSCNADSPSLRDLKRSASRENGGFGFYADSNSVSRRLVNCTFQDSKSGNRHPPAESLSAVFVGKPYNSIVNLEVRNYSGVSFGRAICPESAQIMRSTFVAGGNQHLSMSQNVYFPDCDGNFIPSLCVGGSRGSATYAVQLGWRKTFAGQSSFKIYIKLDSTGSSEGPVHIEGLPFPNQTGGIPNYFMAVFIDSPSLATGRAFLGPGSSKLILEKSDGSPVTNRDLSSRTQILINGTVHHTYGT